MKREFKGSIRNKLVAIILLVTFLTAFIGYGFFVYWYMNNQYKQSLNLSHTVAEALSQNFAKVILLNDVSVAADITTQLSSFKNINTMVLYKKDGTPIYQYSKNNKSFSVSKLPKSYKNDFLDDHTLRLYVDANYLDNSLGTVRLDIEVKSIYDVIKENISMLFSVAFFMIFISYILARYFAKSFTKPILSLVSFLEGIESLSFLKQRIKNKQDNEFGKLYEEVNTMLDRIENSYKEQQLSSVAFETLSGMTITDANQKILRVNQAFSKITGYTQEEVIGKTPSILKSGRQDEKFYKEMMQTLQKEKYWSGEIYNKAKDGTIYPQHLTIQSVLNDEGEVMYYVASFIDLSLQKKTEAKLQYLKQYDVLTGLVNRELFLEKLQNHLKAKDDNKWGTLLSFGIKNFKMINDAYGYDVGDQLLQNIADKLRTSFTDATLLGRVSGDEFIIWYKEVDYFRDGVSYKAKALAEDIIAIIEDSYIINAKTISVSLYVGIVVYKENENAVELFKKVESALHKAKDKDQKISFFDKRVEQIAKEHIDMHTQLLDALQEDQFLLFYQPQYKLDENELKLYSFEALLRWKHPTRGLVSPIEFIPILEKTGLIIPVGKWIIKEVCTLLAQWRNDIKKKDISIAINVSAKQFREDDFISFLQQEVERSGVSFSNIKIELTESLLVEDFEGVIAKMKALRDLGVKISLDDFGTGYSSLEYLKKLPLDQLKIDRTFIKDMIDDPSDQAIVKSIVIVGEALGLEVIAEGIETRKHFEVLKELGCFAYQGYYFSKPLNLEENPLKLESLKI